MASTDQYVFIRRNGEPSKSQDINAVMRSARLQLASGTVDYRLRKNEMPAGPPRRRPELLTRMRERLEKASVGDRFRVYADPGQDGPVFRVHKVAAPFVVIDISGNHNADVYYTTVMNEFPEYAPRYAGSYVCKNVAGSSVPSQHSYGNAVDFFFDTLLHQDVVAAYMVAHATELHIHTVISRDLIWTRADGWHAYSGEYHSHLHCDFDPQYSGPCGVRG